MGRVIEELDLLLRARDVVFFVSVDWELGSSFRVSNLRNAR